MPVVPFCLLKVKTNSFYLMLHILQDIDAVNSTLRLLRVIIMVAFIKKSR